MDSELHVALCNIEVASQIQVYLLNSRHRDDTHIKKAAILKDVKILAQYINEQCKGLARQQVHREVFTVANEIEIKPVVSAVEMNNDMCQTSAASPPRNSTANVDPITPSNADTERVPATPSLNVSGFDRLVAKILSPAPSSVVRTPLVSEIEVIPNKPLKILPSYSLFNDDAIIDSKKPPQVTAVDDNLLGVSTNHSITFNMSRPLSPIIGTTFGTPPRRTEATRMSGRLSGRYSGVNAAEDDVFGSLTLTSVGDWAKLREYLKTQDVKMDQPLDEVAVDFTNDRIDVKEIAGADTWDLTEKIVATTEPPIDPTTPTQPYTINSTSLESEVLVTPQSTAPPTVVETENLYPTPGRRRTAPVPPQPATEVIKLVTPTKGAASGAHGLPTRTMAVTPSIKASIRSTSSPSSQGVVHHKYSTPVKASGKGMSADVSSARTPSTAIAVHHESMSTPSRNAGTPSPGWGMVHSRNPTNRTPPNKMDLRKSWKMAIPSSASGKKSGASQVLISETDSTVKKLF